jgi:ABC-type sugar transport system permease subunit
MLRKNHNKGAEISRYGDLKKRNARIAYLSILPAILILLSVKAYPIFATIYRSFTNWNGLYQNDFIGLSNYKELFSSGLFWTLFQNNLVLLLSVPLQVVLGLIVAVLLYEQVPGWRAFRAIYYIPQIISLVILGYLFKSMFSLDGPVNKILHSIGLGQYAIEWMLSGSTALPIMVFCITWYSIGWQTIVILGGMSTIDLSVFEAARLDGANFWRRTFGIVLPMNVNVITYCIVMAVVWTFTSLFSLIYSMTGGGPGYQTMTLDFMIYEKSFVTGSQLGMACTIAVVLLAIVMIITAVEMKLSKMAEEKWG